MTTAPPAPQLTVFNDADPCPRVEILIDPMPVDAASITIYRNYDGAVDVVRGASGSIVAGTFLIVDYEVALGIEVAYTCVAADSDGTPSPLSDASDVIILDVAEAWAQDPVDPGTSMAWSLRPPGDIILKQGSLTGFAYAIDQSLNRSIGSELPVGISGTRQAATGIPLVLATTTPATQNWLLGLLKQAGGALCVRLPMRVPLLPPIMYLQIGPITPLVDPAKNRIVWSMTGDQVNGPSVNIIVPLRDLDDLAAEAETLDGLGVLYTSLIDLQRGP